MDAYETRGDFPRELIRKAGEAGPYGAVFPESVGGTNLGYVAATVIQEEMSRARASRRPCATPQSGRHVAQPIGRFQMIRSDIAAKATALEASRALVCKAAHSMDHSLPSNRLAAIAKFHASQTAKLCADKAMPIFGGYGLAKESRVS